MTTAIEIRGVTKTFGPKTAVSKLDLTVPQGSLYGFIGPGAAFVLLGIIGVATMFAAALHGPALAGLGLAGSLCVPLLVSSDAPSPWPLVIYLAVVAGAAYALARLRRWLWLAAAVVAGAVLWGVPLLEFAGHADPGWGTALYVHAGLPRGPKGFLHPKDVALPALVAWVRSKDFAEHYRGKDVFFGHTPTPLLPQELSVHTPDDPTDMWVTEDAFGLDTGCGKGGFLTALELPAMRAYESR